MQTGLKLMMIIPKKYFLLHQTESTSARMVEITGRKNGPVCLSLPADASFTYHIFNTTGQISEKGNIEKGVGDHYFDLGSYIPGIYFIQLIDSSGIVYNVKIIKE